MIPAMTIEDIVRTTLRHHGFRSTRHTVNRIMKSAKRHRAQGNQAVIEAIKFAIQREARRQ